MKSEVPLQGDSITKPCEMGGYPWWDRLYGITGMCWVGGTPKPEAFSIPQPQELKAAVDGNYGPVKIQAPGAAKETDSIMVMGKHGCSWGVGCEWV